MNVKSYFSIAMHWEHKGFPAKAAEFYGKALKAYGFDTGEFYDRLIAAKRRCEQQAKVATATQTGESK